MTQEEEDTILDGVLARSLADWDAMQVKKQQLLDADLAYAHSLDEDSDHDAVLQPGHKAKKRRKTRKARVNPIASRPAVVEPPEIDSAVESCAICLGDLRKDVRVLPCAHKFHRREINKWLRAHGDCPTCRTPV